MKNELTLFTVFFSMFFVGCVDATDDESLYHPDHESHARLMGYQGKVRHLSVHNLEENLPILSADFDALGRCVKWNDTGVTEFPESIETRGISSGWLASPASYEYSYNDKGQLISVEQHILGGETEHYAIAYGNHTLVLPLPFPVGCLFHYPVQGIAKIESENYRLVCDGHTAFSERRTLAWMSLTEKTEYVFENGQVVESTTRFYGARGGEEPRQLERLRTFFDYTGKHLMRTQEIAVDADNYQERLETIYSKEHPFMPETKRIFSGIASTPVYETVYVYNRHGSIVDVKTTQGEAYFDTPYHQVYLSEDSWGNWTSASRQIDGDSLTLQQHITYW